MQFSTRKRRNPPSVIIVSLIDVLIVVLIFLMVASTFKQQQQPALKLSLPESKQTPKPGSTEDNLIITINKKEPYLYLGSRPVTLDKLTEELKTAAASNPGVNLSIRADTDAPFGQIVKAMDAAKAAGIRGVNAFTRPPGQP